MDKLTVPKLRAIAEKFREHHTISNITKLKKHELISKLSDFFVIKDGEIHKKEKEVEGEGNRCWEGYEEVKGKEPYTKGSCKKAKGGAIYNPDNDEKIAAQNKVIRENMKKKMDGKGQSESEKNEDMMWERLPYVKSLFGKHYRKSQELRDIEDDIEDMLTGKNSGLEEGQEKEIKKRIEKAVQALKTKEAEQKYGASNDALEGKGAKKSLDALGDRVRDAIRRVRALKADIAGTGASKTEETKDDDPIDWEDIKWGSFTKQFEAWNRQHPEDKMDDLTEFADMILENPSSYQKKTVRRARFYLNVLKKK